MTSTSSNTFKTLKPFQHSHFCNLIFLIAFPLKTQKHDITDLNFARNCEKAYRISFVILDLGLSSQDQVFYKVEVRSVVAKGGWGWGGLEWELGISSVNYYMYN